MPDPPLDDLLYQEQPSTCADPCGRVPAALRRLLQALSRHITAKEPSS